GGGGTVLLEHLEQDGRAGVRITFEDKGPGIADINQALRDGFTTGNGLGLGLGGARRLVNDFDLRSARGEGTTVVITRWK
ncbi:MAG: ATP-binding protein, partial [Thermoanaerobaculia bacterium]